MKSSIVLLSLFCCSIGESGFLWGRDSLNIDPILQKVDRKTSLGAYKPQDLVSFRDVWVSKRIVPDLKKLLAAARSDGLRLKVVSGYRSYEQQIVTFNRWTEREMRKNPKLTKEQARLKANRYSAHAGHSEHQLGTTVDILSAENGYLFSANKKWKYVAWLEKNAHKYHFKISYPEGSEEFQYEPWHVRWYPS